MIVEKAEARRVVRASVLTPHRLEKARRKTEAKIAPKLRRLFAERLAEQRVAVERLARAFARRFAKAFNPDQHSVRKTFKNRLFVRVTGHPAEDLKRGYSFSMGEFGNEDQAHVGLSGYSVATEGNLPDAVKRVQDRMGVGVDKIVLFEGREVGSGPDGEPLFKPKRIVAYVKNDSDAMTRLVVGAVESDESVLDEILPPDDFEESLRDKVLREARSSRSGGGVEDQPRDSLGRFARKDFEKSDNVAKAGENTGTGDAEARYPTLAEIKTALKKPISKKIEDAFRAGIVEGAKPVAQALGVKFKEHDPEVSEFLDEHMTNLEFVLDEVTAETVKEMIREGYEAGDGEEGIIARIRAATDFSESRAAVIARNESHIAVMDGANAAATQAGVDEKEWMTAGDDRVRESHREANGQVVGVDEKFEVGAAKLAYPGDPDGGWDHPGETLGCLLPGSVIQGRVNLAFRAQYDGEAVEVTTRSGVKLSVTTNHRVPTSSGIRRACELKQGDKLVSYRGGHKVDFVQDDENHEATTVEQVFDALAFRGRLRRQIVRGVDFHGDGRRIDGDVDVVHVERELRCDGEPSGEEDRGDFLFVPSDPRQGFLESESAARTFGPRNLASTRSVVSRTHLLGDGLGTHALPLLELRFGSAARLDACLREQAANDVARDAEFVRELLLRTPGLIAGEDVRKIVGLESSLNPPAGSSLNSTTSKLSSELVRQGEILPADCLHGFAGEIAFDEIVHLRRFQHKGSIYDVQSSLGYVVCNGIVVCQCRCTNLYRYSTEKSAVRAALAKALAISGDGGASAMVETALQFVPDAIVERVGDPESFVEPLRAFTGEGAEVSYDSGDAPATIHVGPTADAHEIADAVVEHLVASLMTEDESDELIDELDDAGIDVGERRAHEVVAAAILGKRDRVPIGKGVGESVDDRQAPPLWPTLSLIAQQYFFVPAPGASGLTKHLPGQHDQSAHAGGSGLGLASLQREHAKVEASRRGVLAALKFVLFGDNEPARAVRAAHAKADEASRNAEALAHSMMAALSVDLGKSAEHDLLDAIADAIAKIDVLAALVSDRKASREIAAWRKAIVGLSAIANLSKTFSPDQPRDDHGRWTTAGSGSARDKNGVWRDSNGKAMSAADHERIKALGVPPAWTGLRLNPDKNGDLQAIGRDSKDRAQYLYSAAHSERAAAEKFARLGAFSKELPSIRKKVAADLASKTLSPADREAANVLDLIDKTAFRVGSDSETGAEKKAYGATTLEARHVEVDGDKLKFSFTGKKGVQIKKTLVDKRLAKEIGARVKDAAPGDRIFDTTDAKVRDYMHSRAGDFKVKDYRTYHGTTTALREIAKMNVPTTQKEFASAQKAVSETVAAHLGNTATVARQSYIDPAVWSKWKGGMMKKSKASDMGDDEIMAEFLATVTYAGAEDHPYESMPEIGTSEDEPEKT